MFDDILGPRPTKVRYDGVKEAYDDAKKPYTGEKKAMPAPPNILGGPKPASVDDSEEELELDFDFDDPDDDCCGEDCDCDTGCLKDEDAWSTIG
jgi:hypothetical protein